MSYIFLSGQNQCHSTGVKKSYFCHIFHLRPKKVFWWAGGRVGGWKVTLVSVCVHFWTHRTHRHIFEHTDTKMDTELDNKNPNFVMCISDNTGFVELFSFLYSCLLFWKSHFNFDNEGVLALSMQSLDIFPFTCNCLCYLLL